MIAAGTRRPFVIASVMAAMFMIAIEATIVSTAMPRIIGELGGLQLYSWVFSAFLLSQTAMTVVFGKLADLVGRKKVLLWGIAIFLVGSVLCGFAWSMPSMIAFRLFQGIGAGAIQPVAMTLVGDLYSAHERGKVQGYLASVWAISAVLGPLVGGLIVAHVSWAWIFWMNVPIGCVAALGFWTMLREKVEHAERRIDHVGAGIFALAIAAIMVELTAISTSSGPDIAILGIIAIAVVALFVWRERRSPEPMISLKLWGRRPIAAANAASVLSGMVMIGLTTFLPVYVQGVMGRSALAAGFALSVMVLGWPMGATLAMRTLSRFGVRPLLLSGAILVPIGSLLFVMLQPGYSPVVAGIGSWVVGFGMGVMSNASLVMIQEITEWSERGTATASFIFARNLGSTFGATIFGAVLNYNLLHGGASALASSDKLRELLNGVAQEGGDALRGVLGSSLHVTFVSMFIFALMTAVAAFFAPSIVLTKREPAPAE